MTTTPPLSLAIPIARDACYSLQFFSFNISLSFIAEIAWVLSIAVPFRGCSLVRWRASNDELRSLPTQTLRLSHSFSLVPRAFSPSIAPARFAPRRILSPVVATAASFSLASAWLRSPTFSRRLVLDLAACASEEERERDRRVIAGSPRRVVQRTRESERKRERKSERKRNREREGESEMACSMRKRQERIYLPTLSARR